ncbi:osmoprotectant NAGGN system M42 family peptidase [Kineococcus radiotolerans]|uniref:Peptidase M42 family protein n=1 Tax=Kineococcus radiotolerans (strain ATCC BAA-149 / DSM 14245 / SRS30216) TaxID=266940 RepID=A6WDG7_KINRD|nr:osmoprotectant NAGGN system M42 family peptidase [Kineococcus radiotolerans]ABS04856.1 peptidase M42 family protein [Kineococcus radiotolerans SRS30216 = ATCC BAA-149]
MNARTNAQPPATTPREVDLPVDVEYLTSTLMELLRIPSPSGRTDAVMQVVGTHVDALGLSFDLTRRGILRATLPGATDAVKRAVVVHADTIGLMVKQVKDSGRLEVVPVGSHSARFAEGAHVTIFTDDFDRVYTGTVLPLKSSGHTFGDEIDTQGVGWDQVEVRIDEPVESARDVAALGVEVGDFVALDAAPQLTRGGYVKSRHLDDKAGLAACLAALKALHDADVPLAVTAQFLVTIGEEVGFGATHGLAPDVAELVAVDNAVVAAGQNSREELVSIGMLDMTGPFDYHLSRRLHSLARAHGIPAVRDVYRHYRSDAAPALEAGIEARHALLGFGLDSSHGHERAHVDGLVALARLLVVYLQSGLTFDDWDQAEAGPLADFPSTSVQPAEPEPVDRTVLPD